MRLVLVVLVALAFVPGAAAETEMGSTSASKTSSSDDVFDGPDPPPGSPCRPTCSPATE